MLVVIYLARDGVGKWKARPVLISEEVLCSSERVRLAGVGGPSAEVGLQSVHGVWRDGGGGLRPNQLSISKPNCARPPIC